MNVRLPVAEKDKMIRMVSHYAELPIEEWLHQHEDETENVVQSAEFLIELDYPYADVATVGQVILYLCTGGPTITAELNANGGAIMGKISGDAVTKILPQETAKALLRHYKHEINGKLVRIAFDLGDEW